MKTGEGCGVAIKSEERRSEPRTKPESLHSVEFRLTEKSILYQCKIWNVSSKGICLLLREDSNIVNKIEIGKVLDMKYYQEDMSKPSKTMKTEIRHITLENQGKFKGHYLVGLLILEIQEDK